MGTLEDILKQKFGKVRRGTQGWLRIPCPTCADRDSRKMKRYIHEESLHTKCFICEVKITYRELVGNAEFTRRVKTASGQEDREEHPDARIVPCSRPTPINQLPPTHPAIKFLHKDHLFDLDRYANDYGIIYCEGGYGKTFLRKPFVSSDERIIFPIYFKGELVGWQMPVSYTHLTLIDPGYNLRRQEGPCKILPPVQQG